MKPMIYKGYTARIEYSDEDQCLVGRIVGIHDVIGFHGDSVESIKKAFFESVDDYLSTCEKLERLPQKAYSGKFILRLPVETHAQLAMQAAASGKSLNQWALERLEEAVN